MNPVVSTVYSVFQANTLARHILEDYSIWIQGEVSEASSDQYVFKYFKLKDESSVISCVIAKNKYLSCAVAIENGMQVKIYGTFSLYEPRGNFQCKVALIQKEGTGDLQARIEALKTKLQNEGLLDLAKKRKLPPIPSRIAVITARESAAWKDFYKIINERYANVELILYNVLVQGDKAASQVIRGIEYFNTQENIDLVVITRGGGSLEDLMAFNDELLARAIAHSRYPTVCAIGHEKDISLAELVSDLRASTPSNAAELIVPDKAMLYQQLDTFNQGMQKWERHTIALLENELQTITQRSILLSKEKLIRKYEENLIFLAEKLFAKNSFLEKIDNLLETYKQNIQNRIKQILDSNRNNLMNNYASCENYSSNIINQYTSKVDWAFMKLDKYDPEKILQKGYTLTLDEKGKIIKDINTLSIGNSITTILANGKTESTILDIIKINKK